MKKTKKGTNMNGRLKKNKIMQKGLTNDEEVTMINITN